MIPSYLEGQLGEHEKVILVARQHWFILARSIILEIITILLIFAATITAAIFFTAYLALIVAVGFIVLLIPITTMVIDILKWANHQYIITNRRVIRTSGIFNKNVTDSSLEKVNDVMMTQSALGRIFDYGDIEILTASELGLNLFRRIDSPVQFKKALLNAKSQLEGFDLREQAQASETAYTGVPALIAQLDSLRREGLLTEEEFLEKKAQLLSRI
jgi:uncharacterized membrane protein YdbT with pleckstrin-like domain